MQVTINIPDEFAEVAENIGMTASAYLSILANKEIIKHFRKQKFAREQQTSKKHLLLG